MHQRHSSQAALNVIAVVNCGGEHPEAPALMQERAHMLQKLVAQSKVERCLQPPLGDPYLGLGFVWPSGAVGEHHFEWDSNPPGIVPSATVSCVLG